MKERYTYHFPTCIRFGPGVVDELGPHLKGLSKSRPLIVTDPTCSQLPFFKKIINSLNSAVVFDQIHKNPVKSDVEKGAEFFHAEKCDSIVGIGGGASLDVARAIALKAHHPGDLFDYIEKEITDNIPYFVCIPTTSGTGSEVGRSTVISDDKTHQKKILFSPHLMAKIIFADPELTMELPPAVTASTGLDALAHNIEAYFSKGYHPQCDGIALEAIRLVWKNLPTATHSPTIEARSHMMMSALMGAVAFQKGLGVVHSTAHPLSTVYDTHHGLAISVMLSYGVAFNASHCPDKTETLQKIFGRNDVAQALKELNQILGLPTRLCDIGVQEKDLEKLSQLAFKDGCHLCNPRPATQKDLLNIYQEAL